MPSSERFRQPVSGPFDLDTLQQRIQQGWKIVALEWERSSEGEQPVRQEFPFGSQLASDAAELEENHFEMEALSRMMELIVEEVPYSYIADELNRAGYRTRNGRRWTPVSVFEMLPRLIEAGPAILTSSEWRRRRGVRVERPVP